MVTSLRNCEVPWAISPTGSGLTLIHEETDVSPKCRVVLGAGRLTPDGRTDFRRIELVFELAYFTRTTPHDDSQSASDYGFSVIDEYGGDINTYLEWRKHEWRKTGVCPNPGFYIAESSDWLATVPDFFKQNCNHYLLDGRDGHVELIASQYRWSEWLIDEKTNREWSEIWPLDDAAYHSENGG